MHVHDEVIVAEINMPAEFLWSGFEDDRKVVDGLLFPIL